MGVARSATTLSRIVGPVLAGMSFDIFGRHSPYIAGAALMAVVALVGLYALILRHRAPVRDSGN